MTMKSAVYSRWYNLVLWGDLEPCKFSLSSPFLPPSFLLFLLVRTYMGVEPKISSTNTMASTSEEDKFVCGEGDDCPCYTAEKTRPPAVPKAMKSDKVTVEAGKSIWMCSCGESKKFPVRRAHTSMCITPSVAESGKL